MSYYLGMTFPVFSVYRKKTEASCKKCTKEEKKFQVFKIRKNTIEREKYDTITTGH